MTEQEKLDIEAAISNAHVEITRCKELLASTDYQRLREMDGGEPMTAKVVAQRNDARDKINHYETMIADLTESLEQYQPEIEHEPINTQPDEETN